MGLWTCAVGIRATIVFLAHKVATAVSPPPLLDVSAEYAFHPPPIRGSDLDTTAGCQSAGAQIDPAHAVRLYVRKCIGVLTKGTVWRFWRVAVVLNMEATDGLSSVVSESGDKS